MINRKLGSGLKQIIEENKDDLVENYLAENLS